ncbi:hypothetical protein ACHQM5_013581 [Ranunculus cassubicifolius]
MNAVLTLPCNLYLQVVVELRELSEEERKLIDVPSGEISIDVQQLINENMELKQINAELERKVKLLEMEKKSLSHFVQVITQDVNFDFTGYQDRLSSLRSINAEDHIHEDRRSFESCRSPVRNLQIELAREQVATTIPDVGSQQECQQQIVLHEPVEEFAEEVQQTMLRTDKMQVTPRLTLLNNEDSEDVMNEISPMSQMKIAESGSSHIQVVQDNDEDDIPIAMLKKRKSPPSMVQKIKARANRRPKYHSSEWQKQQRKKPKLSDKNEDNESAMIVQNEAEVENNHENSPDIDIDNSLPLHDITTTPNWIYIGEGLKDYMKRFFQTSKTSTIAWKDIDSDL